MPLQTVNGSSPELDLQDGTDGSRRVGRYKYERNVAAVMGDGSFHATSPLDYRSQKQMRMSASIYAMDINKDNVDACVLEEDFYVYPPADPELLLTWSGQHWKHNNTCKKLPQPTKDHILLQ